MCLLVSQNLVMIATKLNPHLKVSFEVCLGGRLYISKVDWRRPREKIFSIKTFLRSWRHEERNLYTQNAAFWKVLKTSIKYMFWHKLSDIQKQKVVSSYLARSTNSCSSLSLVIWKPRQDKKTPILSLPCSCLRGEFISITYQGNMAEGIFHKARGDKFFPFVCSSSPLPLSVLLSPPNFFWKIISPIGNFLQDQIHCKMINITFSLFFSQLALDTTTKNDHGSAEKWQASFWSGL